MQAPSNKPVVAHLGRQFFQITETFIYNLLKAHKNFHPICISYLPFINKDFFPFPDEDIYSIEPKRLWIIFNLLKNFHSRLIPFHLHNRMRKSSRVCRNIVQILEKRDAKILHAHFGHIGWSALKIKKMLSVPIVTSFYGIEFKRDREWDSLLKELFEEGTLFLVEGPHAQEELIKRGCPSNKIEIQRIGIPVQEIPFKPRILNKGTRVKLLFAGRFIEKKGIKHLLKSIKEIKNIELIMIGDGPLRPWIENFINKNVLENRIKLRGFLSYREYLRQMINAHILVHPSLTTELGDTEGGAPTVILEAQASGMPIVSTLHADIPNVVLPEKSAILTREGNMKELRNAIIFLITHPEMWEKMGSEGRKFVEKNHNIEKEIQNLERIYERVLSC